MKCKFCNQDKKLIKAHIVPEAFFRELKSDKKAPMIVDDSPDSHPKKSPIGVYDKNLVCLECESLWAEWDDYGASFILDVKNREELKNEQSVIADVAKEFNYEKLKLFFISVLWRASASEDEFYSKVQLGPFEEKCKKMISERNPGSDDEFSVVLSRYPDPAGKIIVEPFPERRYGINYYRFSFAGHIASIKVDKRNAGGHMKRLMLRRDQLLLIPRKDIYKSVEAELMLKTIDKVRF